MSELLCFLFCPRCYAIILSQVKATLAQEEAQEEATALGNPQAAARRISPRLGKAAGEYARAGVRQSP